MSTGGLKFKIFALWRRQYKANRNKFLSFSFAVVCDDDSGCFPVGIEAVLPTGSDVNDTRTKPNRPKEIIICFSLSLSLSLFKWNVFPISD